MIDCDPSKRGMRERYRLQDALRSIGSDRQRRCRRVRIAPSVQVGRNANGGVGFSGVETCGSVWSCPTCAARLYAHRAEEIQKATSPEVSSLRRSMLTFTFRHFAGQPLKLNRSGLTRAWRRMWQGRAGQRLKAKLGWKHHVWSLEVTHGCNGWHPHIHVLAWHLHKLTEEMRIALHEAWCHAIESDPLLGRGYLPTLARGVDIRETARADYLAKLGLEIASIATKESRKDRTSRTPWEIARAAGEGCNESVRLWREYTTAMKGARQLFWSQGARKALGLEKEKDDPTDGVGHPLAEWTGPQWDACVRAFPRWLSLVADAASSEHPLQALAALPEQMPGALPPGMVRPVVAPLRECAALGERVPRPARQLRPQRRRKVQPQELEGSRARDRCTVARLEQCETAAPAESRCRPFPTWTRGRTVRLLAIGKEGRDFAGPNGPVKVDLGRVRPDDESRDHIVSGADAHAEHVVTLDPLASNQ